MKMTAEILPFAREWPRECKLETCSLERESVFGDAQPWSDVMWTSHTHSTLNQRMHVPMIHPHHRKLDQEQ